MDGAKSSCTGVIYDGRPQYAVCRLLSGSAQVTQWPMRMSRARLYVLIDALEEDLRDLIQRWLVPALGEDASLGHYAETARELLLADLSADPEQSPLTEYLYLQEATAVLNTKRDHLPSDLADAIRLNTPALDLLGPVRNRVMHGRPLQPEDSPRAVELGNALLASGCEWPNLADVLSRLNAEPSWEPAYLPRLPLRERVLHNLPLPDFDETGLIGRGKEARDLLKRLIRKREPVLTLIGEGGVGKTALAVKVLYDLIDHPDCPYEAVLWTSLKTEALTVDGVRPLRDAAVGLKGMVRQLASTLDDSFEGTIGELSEILQATAALIVIDNLETADSSEVLRLYDDLPDSCSFLFTSRIGLGQLERRLALGPLSVRDSSALFRQLARQRGLDHLAAIPDDALTPIVQALRRNPLALKWYVLSVEAGDEPDLALENQEVLLEFCVRSVYEALSPSARRVLLDIYALDRPVLFSELAVLSDGADELDILRQALHELQRSSLVEAEAEIADRVSQAFALSPSAIQFLARLVPSDDRRRTEIRSRDRQLRTRSEVRRREGEASALAPSTVHVRSHLDGPIAEILSQALALAHDGDESWRERIATAERLAPRYFEVPRVHAFIESTAGRVQHASFLYEKAVDLAEGKREEAVVAYFFAGHLARTAKDPAAALPYAQRAAQALGEDRATLQLGSVLMYLERFDEAEARFGEIAEAAGGRSRLIAVTNLVSLARRRAEWIRSHQHNPMLAATTALAGIRRGMKELAAGVRDRRLVATVVQTVADALDALRNVEDPSRATNEFVEILRLVRLNERHWGRSEEWRYVENHVRALRDRADLAHEVSVLLDEDTQVRPEGVGERHEGVVRRRVVQGGYGFISPLGIDTLEVYFHVSDLGSRFDSIFCIPGARVGFVLLQNSRGPFAKDITLSDSERERVAGLVRKGVVTRVDRNFVLLEEGATGASVFMNASGLRNRARLSSLVVGQQLEFKVRLGPKGPRVVSRSAGSAEPAT